jgi:sarcosine oxidase
VASVGGRPLLEITGGLDHGNPSLVEPVGAALAACDVEHERLTPEGAAKRWPGMRFEGAVIHCPGAGRCLADAAVLGLQQRAAELGADVRFDTGPASVTWTANTAMVRAGDDEWSAPVAVLTVGGWLPSVVGDRAPIPPLRVTRERI